MRSRPTGRDWTGEGRARQARWSALTPRRLVRSGHIQRVEVNALPLAVLAEKLPLAHQELLTALSALEEHSKDMCNVEFAIESGRLYVLQTRIGHRSGRAAVALAEKLGEC